MMLAASPFLPSSMFSSQHNGDDSMHYRPSKDMDTFNSLLPPPIEFVEGSSSGTLAVAEGKYEAINASPKAPKAELDDTSKTPTHTPAKSVAASSRAAGAKGTSLHVAAIDLSWPQTCNKGTGLYNSGNTCFLNSALQCLIHTPPLLKLLLSHQKEICRVKSGFCMSCGLRQVAVKAHVGNAVFSPSPISSNLQVIAKHMRKGRQEDTHEFLRYAIDALQKSCLAGTPPKLDAKIQETTWVHKLFGGRLRSRVTCKDCGHNSDTFDRILDLSLDIYRCDSLRDALRKFIAIDYLKGAAKYKCEKCKKHVNAEKRFTIHEAPLVLTVHLKRFSPLGRKLSHPLQYDDELSLQQYMSVGQFGPTYSLYGVICHAGGGPNSGHYYAFVKSREGRWFEMNDEMVQATSLPTDKKNAYILFYIQNKGQNLEAAVKAPLTNGNVLSAKDGLAKKKARGSQEANDEDKGVKLDPPLIGPLLPSPEILKTPSKSGDLASCKPDAQALALKSRIDAVAKTQARKALESLGNYDSDTDSNDQHKTKRPTSPAQSQEKEKEDDRMNVDGKQKEDQETVQEPTRPTSPPIAPPSSSPMPAVPASSFYASISANKKKRKLTEYENHNSARKPSAIQARTRGYASSPYGSNPLNRLNVKRKRMGI